MARIDLPPRPRILVIALRRLGDVLLTTPLIASLRRAWPDATIDALVFADTAGILNGNPDINTVVAMPAQRTWRQSLKLAAQLWRGYDLAISTQSGDRPTFFALVAGRRRVALVQHAFPCTPCQLEGCERRLQSYSACLDSLTAGQVIDALDQLLRSKR